MRQAFGLVRSVVDRAAGSDLVWTALGRPLVRLSRYATHARRLRESAAVDPAVARARAEIGEGLVVRHGPFAGMRYSIGRSESGSLFPKLLGSYERELHPLLERLLERGGSSTVVDIGCAEGYYAVGLALRLPQATVYAYDTNPKATALCRELAEANGVGDRVVVGAFCDAEALRALPLGARALVVSDCEGYERALFTPELARELARHELLIETHDFVDIEISQRLREVFAPTHAIESVLSIDDIVKAHTYDYEELRGHDAATRRVLLAEKRPATMEWLYLTPLADG